jgi:hypothetical protein
VISLGIDDKTVRRIRDVYRWSWFLSIPDPGSRGSKKAPDPGSATLVKSWVAYPDLVIFQFFPDPAKCSVFYRVRICNHALNRTWWNTEDLIGSGHFSRSGQMFSILSGPDMQPCS